MTDGRVMGDVVAELRELLAGGSGLPWSAGEHTWPQNAALVVVAVNRLPALLDVAETAREYADYERNPERRRAYGGQLLRERLFERVDRLDGEGP